MSEKRDAAVLEYIAIQLERLKREADEIDAHLLSHMLETARLEALSMEAIRRQGGSSPDLPR